jgi:hypothetical protein
MLYSMQYSKHDLNNDWHYNLKKNPSVFEESRSNIPSDKFLILTHIS